MSVFIPQKCFFSQELHLRSKHSLFISYLEFISVLQAARELSATNSSRFTQAPDLEHFCSYSKCNTSGYETEPHWLCFPR